MLGVGADPCGPQAASVGEVEKPGQVALQPGPVVVCTSMGSGCAGAG